MRIDNQEIEQFTKESERPTAAKMLDPAEHYNRIEEILSENSDSSDSGSGGAQAKHADCGVCITGVYLYYLYCAAKTSSPLKGYIPHVPPSHPTGVRPYKSTDRPDKVCQ